MTDRRGIRATSLLAALTFLAAGLLAACGDATASPTSGRSIPATTAAGTPTAAPTEIPSVAIESLEPEPTDTDTGSPGTPPCEVAALKASRGITEVDADDRTTEVVLVAAETCSVDAYPALLLQDANGKVLVSAPASAPGGVDLVGGVAYMSEVRLSNWCLAEAAYPVLLHIIEAPDGHLVTVTGGSFPDEADLPPCVHEDAAPILSGTAWAPSP